MVVDAIMDDNRLRVGVTARLNADQRNYKILMNVTGDSREFAIVPGELRSVAKALASCLEPSTEPDYIVGLAPGGIPIATGLAYVLDIPLIVAYKCRLQLPDEVVWVEPHCFSDTFYLYGVTSGTSVLLIDDEADSGNTLCNAVQSLRTHGIEIVDVGCVVETLRGGESPSRSKLNQLGLDLKSVRRMVAQV